MSRQPLGSANSHNNEKISVRFQQLVTRHVVSVSDLDAVLQEASAAGRRPEELLLSKGVSKGALLKCLAEHYQLPFMEYQEGLLAPAELIQELDMEELKQNLWFPLAAIDQTALVIMADPLDRDLLTHIKETLSASELHLIVGLPADIMRLVEDQQDVNPNYPSCAGRTPLAKLRTLLAEHRTLLAQYRTSLAAGRTGLAFMRTGISFISIGLVLFRIFGIGYLAPLVGILLIVGSIMTFDGLRWYLPARRADVGETHFLATEPTFGTTVLALNTAQPELLCTRSTPIAGAQALRDRWNRLSPVMRRRFFAIDRTDFAEERSLLSSYRTLMARARTGLAFTRTGIAFVGLGIALLRQFGTGPWVLFDGTLIMTGLAMTLEGFHWYLPGRKAGEKSVEALQETHKRPSIWNFMFPPSQHQTSLDDLPATLTIKATHAPGIYGTTGLALERTLIADRRNVKARLRTVMARSRTGMAFIRTGSGIFSVGLGLLVYFGTSSLFWTIFNSLLIVAGLTLIADGLYWHLPAEKIRKQFPYCFGDMEIVFPDYARPSSTWKKVVFSHEDL